MSSVRAPLRQREPLMSGWFDAAGLSDAGLQRDVNEDRFHIDLTRGIFAVIDGVGGHAAGGKAADVALSLVRERLERETGPIGDRIREAVTIANNEVHRLAATRPEWEGMACVLTVAVVEHDTATIGHVGDTRLYHIGPEGLHKVTRDHSPVGEREDAREISESEAMHHPRRNEVYRDVGSDPHDPFDSEFVDITQIPFEATSALLLCSDGLTDLVDAAAITTIVSRLAGDPRAVAAALVAAANAAGGKDNVTVVYVEGDQFTETAAALVPTGPVEFGDADESVSEHPSAGGDLSAWVPWIRRAGLAALAVLLVLLGFALGRWNEILPALRSAAAILPSLPPTPDTYVVTPTSSIAAALTRATPGSLVVVEPGEYREQLRLKDRVRLVSRVPGGASIRLPVKAPDGPAVIATGLTHAEFAGFRIVGDAATPLGVGIFVDDSALSIVDVEITGATRAGIEFGGGRTATLLGSDIHDNPGAAVVVNRAAAPRIVRNTFRRNGVSERAVATLAVDEGAAPIFEQNVFVGLTAEAFAALDQAARGSLAVENWFITAPAQRPRPGGDPRPGPSSRPQAK